LKLHAAVTRLGRSASSLHRARLGGLAEGGRYLEDAADPELVDEFTEARQELSVLKDLALMPTIREKCGGALFGAGEYETATIFAEGMGKDTAEGATWDGLGRALRECKAAHEAIADRIREIYVSAAATGQRP
jgi:hypothetical protein